MTVNLAANQEVRVTVDGKGSACGRFQLNIKGVKSDCGPCNTPPSSCYERDGACMGTTCVYSLKSAGAALGRKRAEMCDPALAQRITGYVLGGISPFGQRRRLPTVIDESCELHETIYVSGGRRGLDLGVAPADLIELLSAVTADVTLRAAR